MRDEGAGGEDKKLEQLHQEFDELRVEMVEVKKCTECKKEVMVKERNVGDRCRPAAYAPSGGGAVPARRGHHQRSGKRRRDRGEPSCVPR